MENSETTVLLNLRMPETKTIKSHKAANDAEGYYNCQFAEQFYTGSLTGIYRGNIGQDEEVAVYVYRKGQFSTETEISNDEDIKFKKAVASAMLNKGRRESTYKIDFLEEGEFEVHFVTYQEDRRSGNLILQGELEVQSEAGQGLSEVKVTAGTGSTLNVRRKEI